MKKKTQLKLAIVIFFIASLLITYIIIALTTQRVYSIPDYDANENSSTQGGEALGEIDSFVHVNVFIGPRSGATDVSLDTLLYVDQIRPINIDLNINPEIHVQIEERHVGVASRLTIYYPAELLKPHTTYNVSGTLMGLSAWWTFTTGSSVAPQQDYELFLSPYTYLVTIVIASIATIIFAKIIWNPYITNKIIQNGQLN